MTPVFAIFTQAQAEGAWPNGSTVKKANSQPSDTTPDGTEGTIIGSIDAREMRGLVDFGYFVLWAGRPVPVFCTDKNEDGSDRLQRVFDA